MIRRVPLQDIDLEDHSFRISEELESDMLRRSLLEVGQLNPVILLRRQAHRLTVVAGFRRLTALRGMAAADAPATVCADGEVSALQAFRLALWDNLSHRRLSTLELGRSLHVLHATCGLTAEILIADYLPLLGLAPSRQVLAAYLALNHLHPVLRRLVQEGRIAVRTAERLAGYTAAVQEKMSSVLGRIRLSASLQRQFLDAVEELAQMQDARLIQELEAPEVLAVLDEPERSPFQKGERIMDVLGRRLYPRLSAARARFEADREEMGFPSGVRLTPDPFFETSRLRVEFEVSSAAHLRAVAAELHRASLETGLERLFKID